MRQQLITWLIEDIAPEIRRSRDAEGEILKFARSHNLATSQVQALGQLYNTAKTLSFFEKSAARRGDVFPILNVDDMLDKFTTVNKSASIPHRFEFDDRDNGCGLDLPECFNGLTHNVLRVETPAPSIIFDNPVKQAQAQKEATAVTLEFAAQAKFEYQEEMRKSAASLVTSLRSNTNYQFDELEADALALLGDVVKPVMDKLAQYCQNDGWPVKRAAAPSEDKLVMDPDNLIPLVESILDNTYRIKAAEEMLQPNSEAANSGLPLSNAKIVEKKGEDIVLKEAATATMSKTKKIDPAAIEAEKSKRKGREQSQGGETESPKAKSPDSTSGGAGQGSKPPGDNVGLGVVRDMVGKPGEKSHVGQTFDELNAGLDKLLGPTMSRFSPGHAVNSLMPRINVAQMQADQSMRDAKHVATLQNLMTTDEILAEADPEQVVNIYNTIRNMAPEIAGDTNVMRVLLRSAVQHEGISPFDLKGILDTELSKQKVDEGQRRISDREYSISPEKGPAVKNEL